MNSEATEYQYGVFYEGRDLGFVWHDSRQEALMELGQTEDKYRPATLVRRAWGPVEFSHEHVAKVGEWE